MQHWEDREAGDERMSRHLRGEDPWKPARRPGWRDRVLWMVVLGLSIMGLVAAVAWVGFVVLGRR